LCTLSAIIHATSLLLASDVGIAVASALGTSRETTGRHVAAATSLVDISTKQ
jgi:hypothetical protein